MSIRVILLLLLLLPSCGELVRFESPQPAERKELKTLPRKLFGDYSSLDTSATLLITNGLIVRYTRLVIEDNIDSTDMIEIKDDTTYTGVDHGMEFNMNVRGDSVLGWWRYCDTIFYQGRGDILKKYKGIYFLNMQMSERNWAVNTLMPISNGVIIGTITSEEELRTLREITETNTDTLSLFNPTKKQMKAFLKKNGFSEKETFLRLANKRVP